jgi:hypothetical protein
MRYRTTSEHTCLERQNVQNVGWKGYTEQQKGRKIHHSEYRIWEQAETETYTEYGGGHADFNEVYRLYGV